MTTLKAFTFIHLISNRAVSDSVISQAAHCFTTGTRKLAQLIALCTLMFFGQAHAENILDYWPEYPSDNVFVLRDDNVETPINETVDIDILGNDIIASDNPFVVISSPRHTVLVFLKTVVPAMPILNTHPIIISQAPIVSNIVL